jgi:AcrR family transcriptional regulator
MIEDPSKAERTRKFIIESTANLFNKHGFAGTSVSELTRATGLSKGSIYGNFGSKEEVAVAAFRFNAARLKSLIGEEVAAARTYRNKLLAYPRAYRRILDHSPVDGGCPILNTAIDSDDDNAFLRAPLQEVLLDWQANIIAVLRAGCRAGELRKTQPHKKCAIAMIALIEGGVMLARATKDPGKMDVITGVIDSMIVSA